jgi:hypothetical protein
VPPSWKFKSNDDREWQPRLNEHRYLQIIEGTKQGKDDYRTCTRKFPRRRRRLVFLRGQGEGARNAATDLRPFFPPTDQRCVSPNGDRRYEAGFREGFKTNDSLLPIPSCGPFANCGNAACLYPFVISYAVKIKVDTYYQANDMPVCIVRLPSPTYPTN